MIATESYKAIVMFRAVASQAADHFDRTLSLVLLLSISGLAGCRGDAVRPIKLKDYVYGGSGRTVVGVIGESGRDPMATVVANPPTRASAIPSGSGDSSTLGQPDVPIDGAIAQAITSPATRMRQAVQVAYQEPCAISSPVDQLVGDLAPCHPDESGSAPCPTGNCRPGLGACMECLRRFASRSHLDRCDTNCVPNQCPPQMQLQVVNPQGIDPNEFLCNGSDNAPGARVVIGDQITGVGPEDTVVSYHSECCGNQLATSNRVCIYAPRFASVRRVTGAELGELAIGPKRVLRQDAAVGVGRELPGLAVTGRDRLYRQDWLRGPDAVLARDRGVPVENVLQPLLAEEIIQLLANLSVVRSEVLVGVDIPALQRLAQAAVVWSVDQEVAVVVNGQAPETITRDRAVRELVVYECQGGRLRICKCADVCDGEPGDTVTFFLRVDNVGDEPLRDIVLTDRLTNRLGYVEGSQKCSVPAGFEIEENGSDSLRLTWKLSDELKPCEGATIEFKCKVR